jgi:anti-sigma B factor antagonist
MEGSTGEDLRQGTPGDHAAGPANGCVARMDLERETDTRVELAPAPFEVRRVDHPLGVVLSVAGELDLATAPLLQEELERAMSAAEAVVIDLSGLGFIDSSGLRILVRAERELRALGRQLVLVRGSRAVDRVFQLTSLDRYFSWGDSPSAALSTALERRNGSQRPPKPHDNQRTSALEE